MHRLARREYPDAPVVGVGAVVLDGNRVLLVRRGQEPMKGQWSIPGGAVELGETLEKSVRREVAEETGLEVSVVAVVEVLEKIVVEDGGIGESARDEPGMGHSAASRVRYHYVLVDFLCLASGGSLHSGTDAVDARWVAHEELNSHSFYRVAPATVAVIEKAFGMTEVIAQHKQGGGERRIPL